MRTRPDLLRVATTTTRQIVTHHKPSYAETQTNRSFFLTVLAATATKRDAKAYIEKYQKPYSKAQLVKIKDSNSLQEFFAARDGALIDVEPSLAKTSPVRVALFTIRDVQEMSNRLLERIADTLSQLHRLGLQPVVIVEDSDRGQDLLSGHSRQVERFVQVLEAAGLESRPINEGLFDVRHDNTDSSAAAASVSQKPIHKKRVVSIYDTRAIKAPACRRQVPVISTVATDRRGKRTAITADSAMKALCRAFGARPETVPFQQDLDRAALTIDKLIIVDRVGGILSPQRKEGSHVFINLNQEALTLQRELATLSSPPDIADRHLRNLETCRACLQLLPDSASAVVTTPEIAASVHGTQHPLIHNLLTDKPVFSPSLPLTSSRTPTTVTTILRRGVPVVIHRHLSLASPVLNLSKLTALMNDSFGRKLDVDAYLARLGSHVEAVIVAGDYEGAAIVTLEGPTKVPYLDKFAVLRAKQGAGGVADILFNALVKEFPDELTWRSRHDNPVNKWYFERARGTLLIPPAPVPPNVTNNNAGLTKDINQATRWRLFWTKLPVSRERFHEYIEVARKVQPTWLKD